MEEGPNLAKLLHCTFNLHKVDNTAPTKYFVGINLYS
jgi:hypothetical protein